MLALHGDLLRRQRTAAESLTAGLHTCANARGIQICCEPMSSENLLPYILGELYINSSSSQMTSKIWDMLVLW